MASTDQDETEKAELDGAPAAVTDWDAALNEALAAVEGRNRDSDIVRAADTVQERAVDAMAAEHAQLRSEVEDLRAELQRAQQGLARAQAENAQLTAQTATLRRMLQRTETDLPQQSTRKLVESLLPALDHLESLTVFLLAGQELSPQSRQAIEMLEGEWKRALARMQVETVEAVGQPFDANLHQMIAQQHIEGQPTGIVLRQVHRGYVLQGKLVRSAAVVVQGVRPTAA